MINKNANCYNNKYVQWAYYILQNVNNDKQIKQKMANFFSANFLELSNFSSSSFWRIFFCKLVRIIKVFKVAPTNRNSSALLLHTSKTCSNAELFSFFSQTFLELIFATKIKTMLLKQSAVDQLSKKYCVYYVSEHLKYKYNK